MLRDRTASVGRACWAGFFRPWPKDRELPTFTAVLSKFPKSPRIASEMFSSSRDFPWILLTVRSDNLVTRDDGNDTSTCWQSLSRPAVRLDKIQILILDPQI